MCSLICYKFQCSSCNDTYYGKTKHHFKVHVSEHMGVSSLTGKKIKSTKNADAKEASLNFHQQNGNLLQQNGNLPQPNSFSLLLLSFIA